MGIKEILELVVIVLVIVYIIREHRLSKRLIRICFEIISQNEKLEEQNELLRTVFAQEYEEVKKKYQIGE